MSIDRSSEQSPHRPSRREILLAAGVVPAAILVRSGFAAVAGATESGSNDQPLFVPVPMRARSPRIPQKGYLLSDLGGGVYGVRDGSYQSMFLVTGSGVVVVDAPASFGQKLLAAIGEVTTRRVTHVVYSHAHSDHIGAAHLFPDNAEYVAHQLTGQLLRRAGDPNRPLPTTTFTGRRRELRVGGERLILEYRGDNHQAGNLFIHAPEHRVLVLIDVIKPRWAPFFRLALTPNVRAYLDATDQVLDYEFDTLITGHQGHFGTRADVEEHGRYLADLQTATGTALGTVDFADAVKDVAQNNGDAQFKVYVDAVAAKAADLMPDFWLTRLGGADVFLRENAIAMTYNFLID